MRSLAVAVIIGTLGLVNGESLMLFKFIDRTFDLVWYFLAGCDNPKVQASSYTSTDAQILTHIPFIAEFTLTCSNAAANIPLYASIDGGLSECIYNFYNIRYGKWVIE